LLRECIRHRRRELDTVFQELLEYLQLFVCELSTNDGGQIDHTMTEKFPPSLLVLKAFDPGNPSSFIKAIAAFPL
jgi:hypothetical protein